MYVLSPEKRRVSNGREMSDDFLPPKSQTKKSSIAADLILAHRLRRRPNIKQTLIIIGIYAPVADPGSKEKGFWVLASKIFLVNFNQFRGLLKYLAKQGSRPLLRRPQLKHH